MARSGSGAAPQAAGGGRRALHQRPWARWLLLAAGVWLVVAVLYPGLVFQGQTFRSADAGNADVFTCVGDASLARGHYPLWNPYLFAGMPSFGSLAYVRNLYPPAALFAFLQNNLGLPPLTWMIGHLLFGGLGMVWLLSRWKLPTSSLLLGAALWLLFPQVVAWGVHGHGSKLGAAMYLPWIVGWTLRALDGAGLRAAGMLGVLVGLQLLRGHFQITYYTLAVTGWLAVWDTLRPLEAAHRMLTMPTRARRLGLVATGLVLGFLIGAALLVPVKDYAKISIRGQDTAGGGGVGLDYATGWSLAPSEIGTFILPAAAGFGQATYLGHMPFNDYPNYFGLLWLALAAMAWGRGGRSLWAALIALSLLAVFASFGGSFYGLLYRVLPFFNKFRVPSMVLVVPAFALAILAARGLARVQGGIAPTARPLLLPAAFGVIGLLMLAGGGAGLFREPYIDALKNLAAAAGKQAPPVLLEQAWALHKASLVHVGVILLAAGGALWLATRRESFRRRGLAWVLGALTCLDLLGVDRLIVHPESQLVQVARGANGQAQLVAAPELLVAPSRVRVSGPAPGAAELAAAAGHDRIWPLGEHQQRNTWLADGVRSLGGYHPAKLARYETIRKRLYGDEPAGRLASWLGARVIVLDGQLTTEQLPLLASLGCDVEPDPVPAGEVWLYRNRSYLPRARLMSRWQPAPSGGGDDLGVFLDGIQSGRIDVAGTVHLSATPVPAPEPAAAPPPAPEFVKDDLDEVTLRTRAPSAAVLVLADMAAPGWSVLVDDRPATLLTADLVLRAVAVPAGEHTVTFRYRDPSLRAGLTLSTIGAILTLALVAVSFLPRWRPTTKPASGVPGAKGSRVDE